MRYTGHVTWSSLEQAGGRRKVLLAAPQGVIAAVNAGPGTIGKYLNIIIIPISLSLVAWRQELGETVANVVHHQSTLVTASGDSHVTLRAWHTETGLLKWQVSTSINVPIIQWPLSTQWRPSGLSLIISGSKKGTWV